ncbi:MAG: HU family DNA-binding protein [Celeribacter sp.]
MATRPKKTPETKSDPVREAKTPVAAPDVTVVSAEPVVAGPELKKPALIDRVVERSGGKKRDVKPVVEAMLEVLGQALDNGEELVLPPLGKVKLTRRKPLANGEVLTARIRRTGAAKGDPIAQTPEDAAEGKADED